MTDAGVETRVSPDGADLVDRLALHRGIGGAPREELAWLAAHGTLEHYPPGHMIARKGEPVDALYVILAGHVAHVTDQGGTWRKVMDYRDGDVAGHLPYSRLKVAPGNSVVQEWSDLLRIDRAHLPDIPVHCPHVTASLVHGMLDRVRAFKASDLQVEKMASLGKLAAGLAHELNNPASAAARSAQLVSQALIESDDAARALGAADLDARQLAVIERIRGICLAMPVTSVLTPLERADREETIADWLSTHNADDGFAAALAETDVTLAMLDELAGAVSGGQLHASLRWVAAGCTVRGLVRDIERAASRVHSLVSSVKRFTYMDHAAAPEEVNIAQGLTDTLAVMAAKARGKSASLVVDVPGDLPCARGLGSELNQVWANLIDNALDAVLTGGRVTASAREENGALVVRILDNGSGIPPELQSRIFEPFFTTKPVGSGTGLGLDIVRRLVDSNNGRLDVESQPGRTEFRVTLPLAEGATTRAAE